MLPPSLAIFFLLAAGDAADIPDVIYYNGHIITLSASQPQARAVAIKGDRFLVVGSDAEVRKTAGASTRQVDLHGRTVLPGLDDSHTHPITAALSEKDGPIPVMNSIAEIQAYIRRQAETIPASRLIFVPKVYSTRLTDRRYPTRYEIDKAAPGRLAMTDNGYASVLNSTVLAKLNITRDTPQPADGKIIKDAKGEPTGLILGAPKLLGSVRQSRQATHADRIEALLKMQKSYNAVGITSTIDRGQTAEGFRVYRELREKNALTVRSYVTYLVDAKGTRQQLRDEISNIPWVTGHGDEWFRVGSLKTVADGGILIGTAYLREPYGANTKIYGYDDPDYRGVLAVPRENLTEMARLANKLGWQMTAHTTGGGATDALLDAYEAADRESSIRDRRFTVTHGNFPNEQAIARAKKLGVVFDCQPAWHHFDGPALKDVFGPARMSHFLPFRSMLDAGIVVAGGSDHMIRFDSRKAINPYNPFFGMWMAITRKTADGAALHPEQGVTRLEALRMWTLNGAYLSFEEKSKGSIEPGKLADMVVISKDFLSCPVDEIKDIEALTTIVGGKTVFQR
ncbi:MAG TPA: amidohydrolase [Bryobacteraceae bacterium]|jgi:predicted amidohydrolase YtcJ|nr:amidohydrolase [Bryobacteraceae bacterium]